MIGQIRRIIDDKIRQNTLALMRGQCETFDRYKFLCGRIDALEDLKTQIKEIERNQIEGDIDE